LFPSDPYATCTTATPVGSHWGLNVDSKTPTDSIHDEHTTHTFIRHEGINYETARKTHQARKVYVYTHKGGPYCTP